MSGHGIRILLIEDDPSHAEMILSLIGVETGEYEVVVAGTFAEASRRIEESAYDLVILDLTLPDLDGIDTLVRVRDLKPRIPIIILTATSDESLAISAMQAGAQDYLVKWEIDHRLILRSIRYAIERKRFELERQKQEDNLRRIAETLPEILALVDARGFELAPINNQAEIVLGYQRERLNRSFLSDLIHPEDLEMVLESFDTCIAGNCQTPTEIEFRIKNAAGEWIWLDSRIIVYSRLESGSPDQLLFAAHDATTRKRAEQKLAQSEARYGDLIENSGLFIATHDIEGRILSANRKILDFLGLKNADELIGKNLCDYLAPRFKPLFRDYLHEVLLSRNFEGLSSFLSHTGKKVVIDASNSLGLDMDGNIIVRCIGRDVTEQKRTEQALRDSEERSRLALEAAGLGAWEWQAAKNTFVQDETARSLLGIEKVDLASFLERVHPEDREKLGSRIDLARSSNINFSVEFRFRDRDGSYRWIEAHVEAVNNPEGVLSKMIGVVKDITEAKLMEAERFRANRLESIGALVSGISHDLNNILSPILMSIGTLRKAATDDNTLRWISVIQKSAERGRDLVEQMVTFGKGTDNERRPVDVNTLIDELLIIIGQTLPKDIEVRKQFGPALWSIYAEPTQINQIILNLFINSRDAMPGGGTLTISTENAWLDEIDPADVPLCEPGRYVMIAVTDTGTGIPQAIINHIFDPYFTTKGRKYGSGLGLSTTRDIVRSHGGFIRLSTEAGSGTTFKIYLPAFEKTPVAERATDALRPEMGEGEGILLIDDESSICDVARHSLESCGYRVLTASSGAEGVRIYREQSDAIEVVVTDLMMPDIDGPQTIREIRRINPAAKIVATSGIRNNDKFKEAAQAGFNIFLAKPFSEEKLLSTIAYLLHAEDD